MAGRTLGMMRGATPGLTRLAAALGGGQSFQQQGFEAESANQSRMMQALAQAQKAQMEAEAAQAKEAREAEAAAARPGLFLDQTAAATGADRPTVEAVLQRIRTGRLPQMPMAGPTMDGSELTADVQIPQEVQSRIGRALSQVLPLMGNQGDMPVSGWAGLLEKVQEMNLRDDMVGGRVQPGAVGRAQNALAGRAELEIPKNLVGNPFTQQIDMAQPWNAGQAGLVGAQTGAQKANARQSDAAAAASRASAEATRASMADGANARGAKAPTGYRWGPDGKSLEPIPGGPADPTTKGAKLTKPPTEGQAKALMFGARMAVADEVLNELAEKGATRPGAIKGVAEAAGNILGLGTDSMGGALADAAGTLTNWTQSDAQQQVEQAQRDFINAILRRESGAVISLGEFRNAAKQYFPQPGDDAKTLRQKAANRRVAIAGMKAEFGEPLTPEFDKVVAEARSARKQPARREGGATGSWGDDDGIKIERIR